MRQLEFLDLLGLAGFRPGPHDRLVRHQSAEHPVSELLARNLLEVYQSHQSRPVFQKADHVISFYGLDGTRAGFFGVFLNRSVRSPRAKASLTSDPWEGFWRERCPYFYELERLAGFEHLEDRLVIEWGRSTLAWCQKPVNKAVLEIRPPGRVLAPFRDYLEFSLSHADLKTLYRDDTAHPEWRSRLSAVAGVYLILAIHSGELYVGSAAGAEGIWGRWRQYAKTGHGGNALLKELIAKDPRYPNAFRFSILQILPRSMAREDVIGHESALKAKLGSQANGLNLN